MINVEAYMAKSKSIITVVGKDQVGIIARVTGYLYENNVNVEDITQSIVAGFFNMMMIVDTDKIDLSYDKFIDGLKALSVEIGVDIRCQKEEIFNMMHRI